MTGGASRKHHVPPRALNHIRMVHERSLGEGGASRRETWSLVEVGGERKVLFEAHSSEKAGVSQPTEQRFMTVRDALRGPPPVARQIRLALED